MTARALEEWKGKTPETAVPDRVKDRIRTRQNDRCDGCGRGFDAKMKPEFDHRPALINGGENRETMIVAVCHECHLARSKTDTAEKSKIATIRKKHRIKATTSRGFRRPPGTSFNWGSGRYERERQR